jgi:hypothetical protein
MSVLNLTAPQRGTPSQNPVCPRTRADGPPISEMLAHKTNAKVVLTTIKTRFTDPSFK